jgi:cytochrome P450
MERSLQRRFNSCHILPIDPVVWAKSDRDFLGYALAVVVFDPIDERYAIDPWPLYEEIREHAPIHQSPRGFWVLARHKDCLLVLGDKRVSSDGENVTAARRPEGFEARRIRGTIDPMGQLERDHRPFLFRDPPDHTRLRGLVASAFTPRMIANLRERIEAISEELIDVAIEKGSIDAVEEIAYPLPVRIICEMMGVPAHDVQRFSSWSQVLARSLDPDFLLSDQDRQERLDALGGFAMYFFELLADRREHLGDDLLSQLVMAEDGGDTLSEGELLSTAILLLVAGHETTVNLLAGSILALLNSPDQKELLVQDPSLARNAVHEFMRFVSPVQLTGRAMLDDIEVAGTTLPKGSFVIMLLAAANRDPDVFADPNRLDIKRNDARHLGFGFGLHHCLGAPLARLEAEVVLPMLFSRTKDIRLLTPKPRYRDNVVLRGLAKLPIELTPL